MNRVYNRQPDKLDGTEPIYTKTVDTNLSQIPSTIDLRSLCSPVFDQGQIGSCTGNATAGALEYLELKTRDKLQSNNLLKRLINRLLLVPTPIEKISRLFIYYNERSLNNDTQEDGGASIRDCVLSTLYYGACSEDLWPYDVSKIFIKPSDAAYKEAFSHKITKYYRFADLEHIKHSLAAGYPVIMGITVYESFESDTVASNGIVPIPNANEQCIGGHAVLAVGYDDNHQFLIMRNSWGPNWGDKGYFYLPYSYVNNPNLASDFWSIRKYL